MMVRACRRPRAACADLPAECSAVMSLRRSAIQTPRRAPLQARPEFLWNRPLNEHKGNRIGLDTKASFFSDDRLGIFRRLH